MHVSQLKCYIILSHYVVTMVITWWCATKHHISSLWQKKLADQTLISLHLLEVEAVGDVVCREEGGDQVGDGAGLAAVGTKLESVESSLPEERQTMTQVSQICGISWGAFLLSFFWGGETLSSPEGICLNMFTFLKGLLWPPPPPPPFILRSLFAWTRINWGRIAY